MQLSISRRTEVSTKTVILDGPLNEQRTWITWNKANHLLYTPRYAEYRCAHHCVPYSKSVRREKQGNNQRSQTHSLKYEEKADWCWQGLHGDDTGVFRGAVTVCHLESCPQWAVDVDLLWPRDYMVWRTLKAKQNRY